MTNTERTKRRKCSLSDCAFMEALVLVLVRQLYTDNSEGTTHHHRTPSTLLRLYCDKSLGTEAAALRSLRIQ